MPRKDPSFRQLVSYMGRGGEGTPSVFHNAYWNAGTPVGDIVAEFERNAAILPARRNGNFLYHEILALSGSHGLSEAEIGIVLSDLAYEYLALRAPGQMAYWTVHLDTGYPHVHLCVSANALSSRRRERISKAEFARIRVETERIMADRYPWLAERAIYGRPREKERAKRSRAEQEMLSRKGSGDKERLARRVSAFIDCARSAAELSELLASEGLSVYRRGKTYGIARHSDSKRFRLSKLGLEEAFAEALGHFPDRAAIRRTEPAPVPKDEEDRRVGEILRGIGRARGAEGPERIPRERNA